MSSELGVIITLVSMCFLDFQTREGKEFICVTTTLCSAPGILSDDPTICGSGMNAVIGERNLEGWGGRISKEITRER